MLTFIAVCLLVLFAGFTFIAWFASQVVGYFIIKWFYKNVLGKPIEEKKDYRGNETYTLFNKERSCITGHIVRRCFLPSGDWVLRDCQTGDTLYNYTQEQRMLKQETLMSEQDKLIQEAKDLGWGCYYSVSKGRCPDNRYMYPRIEFATGKEIWTSISYEGEIFHCSKKYLGDDYRTDSEWIEIGLNEYLSLSPRTLHYQLSLDSINKPPIIERLVKNGVIINVGDEEKVKFKVDYYREIIFFRNSLIRSIRGSFTWCNPKTIYEHIDYIDNAMQKEIRDCKKLYGDEIINKLLEDEVIEQTDKDGEVFYKLNIAESLKKREELQPEFDKARDKRDLALMREIERRSFYEN